MDRRRVALVAALRWVAASVLLVACSEVDPRSLADAHTPGPAAASSTTAEPLSGTAPAAPKRVERRVSIERSPEQPEQPEPRRSTLTIPALGVGPVPVVRYRGSPDDARGTRIQDLGPTASPRGPDGGVGPGDTGNFLVTGHRTSHSAPFRNLPSLRVGDRVTVRSGSMVFVYEISATRWTSFRSERSLAEQSAAVPGRPGAAPVRPMVTLSTCATPEDHAAGNFWSDRFGNPEHRIDKIGVLVGEREAG